VTLARIRAVQAPGPIRPGVGRPSPTKDPPPCRASSTTSPTPTSSVDAPRAHPRPWTSCPPPPPSTGSTRSWP